MGKVKQMLEKVKENDESEANRVLNTLVQKHYEHDNASKIKDEVIKNFKKNHYNLLYTFIDSSSGIRQVDEENIENSLSDVVEDKINEKTKDHMDNTTTEIGG